LSNDVGGFATNRKATRCFATWTRHCSEQFERKPENGKTTLRVEDGTRIRSPGIGIVSAKEACQSRQKGKTQNRDPKADCRDNVGTDRDGAMDNRYHA
jgi:hypothetical protein